jgi:hypothetical protein
MGVLGMFLLKEASRNSINNKRESGYFSKHYQQIFASPIRIPYSTSCVNWITWNWKVLRWI